ncbi:MAG: methyltransferase domain-containing protein [Verrucomicrobiota bacterium]
MNATDRKRIAALFPGRFDRNYVASKLQTDPLYAALAREIQDSPLPLLDLGCGLGLVAFYLRLSGVTVAITGIDYDRRKIATAERAAATFGNEGLSFAFHDLQSGIPAHEGNLCVLDILQYFTPAEQQTLLESAASRVAPGGKLIIRSGLRDRSVRFKITVLGDLLAKATFWMKGAPKHYPTAEDFQRLLSPHGEVRITSLWGGTPFNNHLIVLKKSAAPENR